MDPDEPLTPWFDDVFCQLGEDRSAALRRRLAVIRVRVAALIAAEHPEVDLTPDLFVGCVPALVLEANLPASGAAARTHVSAVSRLVDAARSQVPDALTADADEQICEARRRLAERAAQRPDDPWAHRIPRRLLLS